MTSLMDLGTLKLHPGTDAIAATGGDNYLFGISPIPILIAALIKILVRSHYFQEIILRLGINIPILVRCHSCRDPYCDVTTCPSPHSNFGSCRYCHKATNLNTNTHNHINADLTITNIITYS